MAFLALSLGNGGMGDIKYDPPVVGAVWIVAGNTVGSCHRIVHVLFLKTEFVRLVARITKGRNFICKQGL